MPSRSLKLLACVIGLAVAAVPTHAATAKKHKKLVAARTTVAAKNQYRGANLFPAGPIYFANDYMGDDPDPFIRLQLQRDMGRYGGDN
ncbi:MAG: hypothetical protein WDN48_05740 [Pseudolabrys sp.]